PARHRRGAGRCGAPAARVRAAAGADRRDAGGAEAGACCGAEDDCGGRDMTPESFLGTFDTLAETPGSVQKLRSLILRWAEQGQLVAQHPTDAPAEQLFAEVARDRASYAREHGITRQRAFPPIEDAELPFPAPPGWSWARMGELCRA